MENVRDIIVAMQEAAPKGASRLCAGLGAQHRRMLAAYEHYAAEAGPGQARPDPVLR